MGDSKIGQWIWKGTKWLAVLWILNSVLGQMAPLCVNADETPKEGETVFVEQQQFLEKLEEEESSLSGNDIPLQDGKEEKNSLSGNDIPSQDGKEEKNSLSGNDVPSQDRKEEEDDTVSDHSAGVSGNGIFSMSGIQRDLTQYAGMDELKLSINVPTSDSWKWQEESLSGKTGFRIEFPDDYLLKDTYTLHLPDNFQLADKLEQNITTQEKIIIGSIVCVEDRIQVSFAEDIEGNPVGESVNTVKSDDSRKYKGVFCEVFRMCKFQPQDNDGHEELIFGYGDAENAEAGQWGKPIPVDYPPRVIPMSVRKNAEKQDDGTYKCTTIIIPGNVEEERKDCIVLAEKLQELMLANDKEVTFKVIGRDGAEKKSLTLGNQDYQYSSDSTNSAEGYKSITGYLAYTIDKFGKTSDASGYAEDDKLIFTYYVKENPEIYSQADQKTLFVGAGIFEEGQYKMGDMDNGRLAPKGELASWEQTVKPMPVQISYEIKEKESGKKYLLWTATLNGNAISMWRPELTIRIQEKGGSAKYLSIQNGSATQTDSLFQFGITDGFVSGNNGILSGAYPGTDSDKKLLSKKTTVTFITDILDSFYEETNGEAAFYASIDLTWYDHAADSGSGQRRVTKWNGEMDQPVTLKDNLIQKTGTAAPSEGKITWEVTVNTAQLALKDVMITDTIPAGLKVVKVLTQSGNELVQDGTNIEKPGVNQWSVTSDVQGTQTVRINAGDLEHADGKERTKVYRIVTEVEKKLWYGNITKKIANTANLSAKKGSEDVKKETEAEVTYKSELLKKTGTYNKGKQAIDWTVTVNTSETNLTNLKLTDEIEKGLQFVEDSVKIVDIDKKSTVTVNKVTLDSEKRKLTIDFGAGNNGSKTYEVTYSTVITDLTKFDENTSDNLKVANKAVLTSTETENAKTNVFVKQEVPVSVSVIKKETKGANQNYTKWQITINDDFQNLRGDAGTAAEASISDTYQVYNAAHTAPLLDGVAVKFNPADMVLTAVSRDGSLHETIDVLPNGAGVTIGQDAVVDFNNVEKKFTVYLPIQKSEKHASAQYTLEYKLRTSDIGQDIEAFSIGNGAVFDCDRGRDVPKQETGDVYTGKIVVDRIHSGGNTDESVRSLTVTKVDKTEHSQTLPGAVLELYNKYGLADTKTTDENGKAVFENLSKELDYEIREKKAPEGYLLLESPAEIKKGTDASVAVTIENEKAREKFSFTKMGECADGAVLRAEPLQRAEFTLYKQNADGTAGAETTYKAESGSGGRVDFNDVPYGKYIIKETKAPKGYQISQEKVKVTFTQVQDGTVKVVMEGDGDFKSQSRIWNNKLVRADVTVKIDRDGNGEEDISGTEASGATFILKDKNGNTVAEKKPGSSDNSVVFEDVPYGSYEVHVDGIIDKTQLEYENWTNNKAGEVTIPESGAAETVTLKARKADCKVTVKVVEKEKPDRPLAGCRIRIFLEKTSQKRVVFTGTTDETGAMVAYLAPTRAGEIYRIIQSAAQNGFDIDTSVSEFTLDAVNSEHEYTFYDPVAPDRGENSGSGSSDSEHKHSGSSRTKNNSAKKSGNDELENNELGNDKEEQPLEKETQLPQNEIQPSAVTLTGEGLIPVVTDAHSLAVLTELERQIGFDRMLELRRMGERVGKVYDPSSGLTEEQWMVLYQNQYTGNRLPKTGGFVGTVLLLLCGIALAAYGVIYQKSKKRK